MMASNLITHYVARLRCARRMLKRDRRRRKKRKSGVKRLASQDGKHRINGGNRVSAMRV